MIQDMQMLALPGGGLASAGMTSDGGLVIATRGRAVKLSPAVVRGFMFGADERHFFDSVQSALEKLSDPLYDFDMGPTLAAWERP